MICRRWMVSICLSVVLGGQAPAGASLTRLERSQASRPPGYERMELLE